MSIHEFVLQESVRGDCYRLLAACFYYPRKEEYTQENLFNNLTDALKRVFPPATVFSENMGEAFSLYSDEELLVDFSQLFVGPYELKAPPYGSVYLDKGRKVMGDSTMEVMEMYREAGLAISDDFKELPDHIAAELEFMYYLIFKEIEALENSDIAGAIAFINRQKLFLDRFLKRWIQPFCNKMREGASSEFYRALADCACAFIKDAGPGDALHEELRSEEAQA